MAEIESLTVTLTGDMAAVMRSAIAAGDYASTSEIVREALRDWALKCAARVRDLDPLKADIERGLADVEAGRVRDFDVERVAKRGRTLSDRSLSG